MIRLTPRTTRTDTRFPDTTLFRSHSVELTSVVPGRLYRADTDDEPESPSRDRSTQGRDRLPHQHQGGAGDRAATPEDRPAPRAGGDATASSGEISAAAPEFRRTARGFIVVGCWRRPPWYRAHVGSWLLESM